MNVEDYLNRIQHASVDSKPTLETLRSLHHQHLYSVPFENLDIHFGVPIVLDRAKILEKIVVHRRGGFCYELNTAFAWLLSELGYDVTFLSAEVARPDGSFGIPFDHMALRVDLGGTSWLADVGFGDSFLHPLPLTEDARGEHRLERDGDHWFLREGSKTKYRFTLTPRRLEDFEEACRYQQTSEESTFTQRVVTTRFVPEGRVTLTPSYLLIQRGNEKIERRLEDETAWRKALEEHFGIVVEGRECV